MSIEQLVEATASLNAADAFRPRFDAKRWAQFGSFLQQHKLRTGDMLVRFHDQDRNMYLLESGSLQVYVPDDGTSKRRPVAILRPGSVVGEPSMFGDTPRMAQVEAMSPAVVWVLTRPRFEELLARVPDLGIELLRAIGAVMAERMRANLERGQPIV
ncbi:cyclic nucleotide-binding domain-containing protein [Ideonella sp. B7]|uniref:Crp/Fnr family transcriptional regulator n=1 Tax=Ideonella benzenivorans TaxID=2831643 RepID=UPI001CECDFB4|nr:cyclic nucleotide-binding domain-containing protein [Ideonella benzenivorans]MCA6218484.1 cyclic nucleotide-binding domain-containing protein [Ideonella benzenivorans]